MIAFMALALLCAVALLLLRPDGLFSTALRKASSDHPRVVMGIASLLAVILFVGGLWSSPERRETDAQGYGELWYMVQTSPQLRDEARTRMADGILTGEELQELRERYRQAPGVEAMRSGVGRELAR